MGMGTRLGVRQAGMMTDPTTNAVSRRISLPDPAPGVGMTSQTGNDDEKKDSEEEVQHQFPEFDHLCHGHTFLNKRSIPHSYRPLGGPFCNSH
jgi:hypothetical protein